MNSRWKRILNTKERGRGFIARIWQEGYEYSHTSQHIHERYLQWRKEQGKCPGYVWEYLNGYYDAISAIHQKNNIRFMYLVDGKLYGIDRQKDDYYEKNGISPEQLCNLIGPVNTIGDFYWSHSLKKF